MAALHSDSFVGDVLAIGGAVVLGAFVLGAVVLAADAVVRGLRSWRS